jgi:hypothetical protein
MSFDSRVADVRLTRFGSYLEILAANFGALHVLRYVMAFNPSGLRPERESSAEGPTRRTACMEDGLTTATCIRTLGIESAARA